LNVLVRTYLFTGVLRGLRYLDSQPPPRTDRVEACRPQGPFTSLSVVGNRARRHRSATHGGSRLRRRRSAGSLRGFPRVPPMRTFDVVVVGAGPAGEVAAGRLADAGLEV